MKKVKKILRHILGKDNTFFMNQKYYRKYKKYAFGGAVCSNYQQFEASITRLYHTVEKGLAYVDYRAGFGKDNVKKLICLMKQYAKLYDTEKFFYKTAVSTLNEYIKKNKEYGYRDLELEQEVNELQSQGNEMGGILQFNAPTRSFLNSLNYEQIVKNRHSIRHFSTQPVDIDKINRALDLAQFTPSACNRQGWKARVILDKKAINIVLENQNGNSGFGKEIDKLIVITGDLRYFNSDRELHQVFIDGGMYAMSVLNALYYEGIASVPLSASLTFKQEKNIRPILKIDDAEVFILIIGIGNYPDVCQTTRSERKPAEVDII